MSVIVLLNKGKQIGDKLVILNNKCIKFKCIIASLPFIMAGCSGMLGVDNLTCDYRENPMAMENAMPYLSWQMKSNGKGVSQSAYRILVADDEESLSRDAGNCWDSGWRQSGQSLLVKYGGTALRPYRQYYWKVQVEDEQGKLSRWSKTAMWRCVSPNAVKDWVCFPVGKNSPTHVASVWFRHSFLLDDKTAGAAWAEIGTPGFYELYVNGRRVGTDILSPAVTGRDRRTFYMTYDIAKYLKRGVNVIGVWIGRGWYGTDSIPFHFSAVIPLKRGKNVVLSCSPAWKAAESNYATTGAWDWAQFGGEEVDARRRNAQWNKCGFDDTTWQNAIWAKAPSPSTEAQTCEENRYDEQHKAKIEKMDKRLFELDFGTNLTGFIKMPVVGAEPGDTVRIYYADNKRKGIGTSTMPAGNIPGNAWEKVFIKSKGTERDTFSYQTHNQMDIFIASGTSEDLFQSRFNYHGFRYAIVEGCRRPPRKAYAYCIESDLKRVGKFLCSDTLLNKMHEVDDRTMRSLNLGAVYVDCPTRERLGYGDAQVSVESSICNYYMPNFYRKFSKDWALRQDTISGFLPHTAPNRKGGGGIGWGGILAAMSWRNYLYYGDSILLRETYDNTLMYLKYIESKCVNGIYAGEDDPWSSIGDWLAPGRGMDTNNWPEKRWNDFFNNCYRVILWRTQLAAALALNKKDDAEMCRHTLERIVPLIHHFFFNASTRCYVSEEQTYLLMPLVADIVPDSLKMSLESRLVSRLSMEQHIETGMLGTYFLLHYLQDKGYDNLLYKLIANNRYPGWGYMLSQGATTWWEQWNGYWSRIHSCFTSLDSWFYQGLAGITPLLSSPGMKHFKISPAFVDGLTFVRASTHSMYGEIKSEWKRRKGYVELKVGVPANCSATIESPAGYAICAKKTLLGNRGTAHSLVVKSGEYKFRFYESKDTENMVIVDMKKADNAH